VQRENMKMAINLRNENSGGKIGSNEKAKNNQRHRGVMALAAASAAMLAKINGESAQCSLAAAKIAQRKTYHRASIIARHRNMQIMPISVWQRKWRKRRRRKHQRSAAAGRGAPAQ